MKSRIQYFRWALFETMFSRVNQRECPACQNSGSRLIRRKYMVTALRECPQCSLRFRTPKDKPADLDRFYGEEEYRQDATTDLPSEAELAAMIATQFENIGKNASFLLEILRTAGLKPGARILDFGSSWGYTSWQMRQAGFDTYSYEVGRDRERYAREKLGCTTVKTLDTIAGTMDCFSSLHVIEHLPNPRTLFDDALKVLRSGGLLLVSCPNGARERERRFPQAYHLNWNQVHPLMLTPEFMLHEASRRGFEQCAVMTSPLNLKDVELRVNGGADGDDLYLIANAPSKR